MAETTVAPVVTVYPWPHFQARLDDAPAIGGQLYSYAPGTVTPKQTYADPFLTATNTNPVVLNDQGAATVYLDGFYDLWLYDRDGELLWQVDTFTFSSGVTAAPGHVQTGTAQVTLTAIDNAAVLTATNLVPAGYRVLGVRTAITTTFGTARGLQALLIGDPIAQDRWGRQATLTAITGTTQASFRAGDSPIATGTGYSVLIAADGGRFDSQGAILLTAHWERFFEAEGDPSTGVEYGSASLTVQAQDGARTLTVGGIVPLGARVLGITTAITSPFGMTKGLQAMLFGDAIVQDRWGRTTQLTASSTTGQGAYRAADCPISPTAYTLLVAADGGLFDTQGEIEVTVFWSTLAA